MIEIAVSLGWFTVENIMNINTRVIIVAGVRIPDTTTATATDTAVPEDELFTTPSGPIRGRIVKELSPESILESLVCEMHPVTPNIVQFVGNHQVPELAAGEQLFVFLEPIQPPTPVDD